MSPGMGPLNSPERKRIAPPIKITKSMTLPGFVNVEIHDLRAFAILIDIFDSVFAEV